MGTSKKLSLKVYRHKERTFSAPKLGALWWGQDSDFTEQQLI